MVNTVQVSKKILELCSVKARIVDELTRDEIKDLMYWCDCQSESLWDGMSLQEILNVYRASAEWDTFESWAEEDWIAAYNAWNSAIINPRNLMLERE